jgi:hypothetical protein
MPNLDVIEAVSLRELRSRVIVVFFSSIDSRGKNRPICPVACIQGRGNSHEVDSLSFDADAVVLGSFDGAIRRAAAGCEFRPSG